MIDIGDALKIAHTKVAEWSPSSAVSLARRIASASGGTVDWDVDAGEAWVRVIDTGNVVALVALAIPMVIMDGSVSVANDQCGIALPITVANLDAPMLSANPQVLNDVFHESPRLKLVDPLGFSANDLWYATV